MVGDAGANAGHDFRVHSQVAAAARQLPYSAGFARAARDDGAFTLRHRAMPMIVNGRCNSAEIITLSIGFRVR